MSKLSKSPDRFETWKGKEVVDSKGNKIDLYDMFVQEEAEKENDPDWCKNNLEYDLRTSEFIINKVRSSREYAEKLYAALCNNEFIKRETWTLIKDDRWSCSWRYAGGIVAHLTGSGDYIDWYCGGDEGYVDDEIKDDLYNLGWNLIE